MRDGAGHHLRFSIGRGLWDDLMQAALPMDIAQGSFDVTHAVGRGLRQLQLEPRVRALLSTQPEPVHRAGRVVGRRLRTAWTERRARVAATVDDLIRIEGDWTLAVDDDGTAFRYGTQRLGVDARLRAVAHGRVVLLRQNVEIPFVIQKRLGASCHLGNIRYDAAVRAIVGDVADPSVHLGEHPALRVLNELVRLALLQQVHRFSSIPILRRDQVEEMVAPAGGPLRVQMGVEDVGIEVTEDDLTLQVTFGFRDARRLEDTAAPS